VRCVIVGRVILIRKVATMLQGLAQHANKIKFLLNENSTTILTGVGVVGTVATAVLTGRATFKAADLILEKQIQKDENFEEIDLLKTRLSKTEKAKLIWPLYLPPVASGVLTVTCIIMANRISSKKIAALTIAAGVSERAFQEYKEKVVEKLGMRQDQKIRDEVAQDRVRATPLGSQVLVTGSGEVLCFDSLTGRYFTSTMEEIRRAENKVNYEMLRFNYCSLSFFYEEIGLAPTTYTDTVGWGVNNPMEVQFSTVLSDDNRPCLVIDFSRAPVPDYEKNW
jgi:hypothetical protein